MSASPSPPAKDLLPRVAFFASCLFLAGLYGFCAARYQWFPSSLLAPALAHLDADQRDARDMSVHHVHVARHDLEGVRTYGDAPPREAVMLVTGFWPDRDGRPGARVIDRAGATLHHWDIDPAALWPSSPHTDSGAGLFNVPTNYIHGSYLFENGDLLFNIEFLGLARIRSNGEVVWRLDLRTHHSVARDDDGNFWVCMVRWIETEAQRAGRFKGLELPLAEDCVVKVSPDGEVLQTVSMLETVYDSDMRELLWKIGAVQHGDALHLNDVEPLSASMADQYPLFDPGDLVVSLRHIDAVFVFDPGTREVKWSAHEPFMRQHDPDFIGDGWISVFDNRNDPSPDGSVLGGSRLWLLRPHTGEQRLVYPDPEATSDHERPFYTNIGGKAQRFDDGHWLLTEAQYGRIFEIDPDGNTVWEWGCARRPDGSTISEMLEGTSYPFSASAVRSWPDPPESASATVQAPVEAASAADAERLEKVLLGAWGVDPSELRAEIARAAARGELAKSMAKARAAQTRDISLQFRPDGSVELRGGGMDGDGRYRVDKAKGRTITVTITGAEKIPGTLTFTIVDDDHVRMSDLGQAWELALTRK